MFTVLNSALPGVFELRPIVHSDRRGRFVKTFQRDFFASHGMETEFAEQYHSTSARSVIRGLHFQTPPHDHAKLVTCLDGEVFDVVLDLRRASPTYGAHATFRLNGEDSTQVYVPRGCAHGFCTLSERATMLYNVTTVYAPSHDSGIRWNMAGIVWPVNNPIVSERDAALPVLAGFDSSF